MNAKARQELFLTKHPSHGALHLAALAIVLSASVSSRAFENTIVLPTELKISGVSVSLRAPLGLRYRPGEAFPLEIHVENPGPAMDVELMAVEGGDGREGSEWAERGVPSRACTLITGTTRFQLPMRAPAVSANIMLILRGGANGSGRAELFRSSLSRVLRPIPPGGRITLVCGGRAAPQGPQDYTARLSPSDLPTEGWMWESVDWVVLNDGGIKDARPEAREALRRWLLGGGRLFLGSREAFAAALSLRLLPMEPEKEVRAELNWWEKNAGLTKDDVLASKNFRPVYARLRHGFGQIVFLFPGSEAADADGAAVFNRPDLQRRRAELPDARVQPERFGAFAPAAPSASRRGKVMLWSACGALILCATLLFARTSRTKIEAALIPVGAGALLAVLLANSFPQQELTISRVCWERRSADGAAVVSEEWALLEAFRRADETSARGPKGGTLAPRFDELDDLRAARLDRWTDEDRPALEKILVAPNQPALIQAASIALAPRSTAGTPEKTLVVNSLDTIRIRPDAQAGMDARRALWIRANGDALLLKMNTSGGEYNSEPYTARALEIALAEDMDNSLAKARAKALSWAVEDAKGEGGEALIFWTDSPRANEPLIEIPNAASNAGNDFFIRQCGGTVPVPKAALPKQ